MSVQPRILWLATGGTISGLVSQNNSSESQYKAGVLTVADLLSQLPELEHMATWVTRQLFQIASQNAHFEHFIQLRSAIIQAQADKEIDAILVTHGTDTLEDSIYFLYLSLSQQQLVKPVIFTASMLPFNVKNGHAIHNLETATKLLIHWVTQLKHSAKESIDAVLGLVMNQKFIAPIFVHKHWATGTAAFDAPNQVTLNGAPCDVELITRYWRSFSHELGLFSTLNIWQSSCDKLIVRAFHQPVIEVLYCHPGLFSSVQHGFLHLTQKPLDSLVVAAYGQGNLPEYIIPKLEELLYQQLRIVITSRSQQLDVRNSAEVLTEQLGLDSSWQRQINPSGLPLLERILGINLSHLLIKERFTWVKALEGV